MKSKSKNSKFPLFSVSKGIKHLANCGNLPWLKLNLGLRLQTIVFPLGLRLQTIFCSYFGTAGRYSKYSRSTNRYLPEKVFGNPGLLSKPEFLEKERVLLK